jgi:hypothetical protein
VSGFCISSTDPCAALSCNAPPSECQETQGKCLDGGCVYTNKADGTFCGAGASLDSGNDSLAIYVYQTCQRGVCTTKTSSEVTSFAYDTSISTGIVSAAFGLEMALTRAFSPDLAAFAITQGLVAIGWTAYSRDQGAFPADRALVRVQNAFVFIAAGVSIILAFKFLHEKPKHPTGILRFIAIANLIFVVVALGLISQLLDQHFDRNSDGVLDHDANILFNWAYPATIYHTTVSVAVAVSILTRAHVNAGFGAFQAATGIIALAWASNQQDEDSLGDRDLSDTFESWVSFTIISGSYSFLVGLFLVFKGDAPAAKPAGSPILTRALAAGAICCFFVILGQVASLYDEHYVDTGSVRGNNMLIVGAGHDNYGNAISPFAWPISIWTAAVVFSFGVEVLKTGTSSTGITALALTEAANLLGWAAQHTYFGSAVVGSDSIEGTTRGWQSVSLGGSLLAFFLAVLVLRANSDEHEHYVHHDGEAPDLNPRKSLGQKQDH